jgi:hypothetical protein
MFNWLFGKKQRKELPEYSALRQTPTQDLPPDLAEQELGQSFLMRRQALQHELVQAPQRPAEDKALFTGLLARDSCGVVTMTLPDQGGHCWRACRTLQRLLLQLADRSRASEQGQG